MSDELMPCACPTCGRYPRDAQILRRLLAYAYSGASLYTDDGELQDGNFPVIDYLRDTVDEIESKIQKRGRAKIEAAGGVEKILAEGDRRRRIGELVERIVAAVPKNCTLILSENVEGAFSCSVAGGYAHGRDAVAALEALAKAIGRDDE